MNCDCWDKAYWPVIDLLDQAAGVMYYRTPDYEFHQQMIANIVNQMKKKFKCIDRCWEKVDDE